MNQPDPTTSPTTEPECRWTLTPRTGAEGWVDGGWWPRSTDPATEFPPLIAAMSTRGLPVLRVSFHLGAWDAGARRLTVHDTVVELEGFRSAQPHIVTMMGPHRRRTRLLVIPPATPAGAARAALRAAADIDTDATAEDILRWNNVPGASAVPPRPRRHARSVRDNAAP
ncbi:DUF5994 family protein [Saccharothrix obliqua]|uniref:DUF5994 family protein n=1 Tax=Saccharothrix obliqua TaxID=2861747 RepID=UPI001C5EC1F5|nr:DUF5994 family protein [Saccharothrix obliqua]MBW4722325.1 hypothetical protein [Saccharothrix obliqua]